jgi:hypothetical protein
MIRFAWLQARAQAATAAAGLVAVAILAALTGPHLEHLYDTAMVSCHSACRASTSAFLKNDRALRVGFDALVAVIPGILGVFWGAPLIAAELEQRTIKLALTQSVSRSRWLTARLVVVSLASVVAAGLISLIVTLWATPLDHAQMSPFATFDYRGVVPLGYAAFAVVLGVTLGLLLRRTLRAMALTLIAFLVVRLAANHWLRPHLITPLHEHLALNPAATGYGADGIIFLGAGSSTLQPAAPNIPRAWITSLQIVNHTGARLSTQTLARACPQLVKHASGTSQSSGPVSASGQQTLHNCVARISTSFHELVSYQPASRYWTFQWLELAIYLATAISLAAVCFWLIRRQAAV